MNAFNRRELGEREGFVLVAYKEEDLDSHPDEFDCYDDADKQAWRESDWNFVTVVVKAFMEGIELGEVTLSGVEDGHLPGAETDDNPTGFVDAFGHTLGVEKDHYDIPG
jgi:hypothetical protein